MPSQEDVYALWICFSDGLLLPFYFVNSFQLTLFKTHFIIANVSKTNIKGIIPVYIFYQYYPGLSYVENHMSIYFDKATLISP